MRNYSAWEEATRRCQEQSYIDPYPEWTEYRDNDLLRFFAEHNLQYHLSRKAMIKAIGTKEQALDYISQVRRKFRLCLGDLPATSGSHSVVAGKLDKGTYWIDKIRLEGVPGLWISANFYYPKQATAALPAILLLCGHALEGKADVLDVSFCVEAVLNGFCVLVIDPLGQGERKLQGLSPVDAHCLIDNKLSLIGEQLAQYMMLDNVRAVDYLLTRPEVDPQRIAVTGNSGGGNMTAYMAAYDDRIAAFAPSCWITEWYALFNRILMQDAEQCLVNMMKLQLDCADLIVAAAPKPCMIGSALFDFFPIEGTRDAFIEAKRIFRLLDANDNLDIYIASKGHGFWHDTRTSILRFFCSHFDVPFIECKGIDYERLPAEHELLCFTHERAPAEWKPTIHEIIRARWEQQQSRFPAGKIPVGQLRARIADVLQLNTAEIVAEVIDWQSHDHSVIREVKVTRFSFYSERNMRIRALLYERPDSGKDRRVLVHIGENGLELMQHGEWLDECSAVCVVEPRGVGLGKVDDRSTFGIFDGERATCHNAAMLGKTMQGMRVLDAMASIRILTEQRGIAAAHLVLSGEAEHALTALYAALLCRVEHVGVKNLPESFSSLLQQPCHSWGTAMFVHGILEWFDIDVLLDAFPQGNVQLYGKDSWKG